MRYELIYSKKVRKYLVELDLKTRQKIIDKLEYYCFEGDPSDHWKELKGEFVGKYRFRIGDYRAICEKRDGKTLTILTVLKVGHRKDIYD